MTLAFCQCGCGQQTRLAPYTHTPRGWKKGKPLAFVHGHNRRKQVTAKLDPTTGCWLQPKREYGAITVNREILALHREAYRTAYGEIPEGHHVHHICETPTCINPAHLEALSPREHRRRHAKLSQGDVAEIRRLADQGQHQRDIAVVYGVSETMVSLIRRRLWTWEEGRVARAA